MIEKLDIAALELELSIALSAISSGKCFAGDRPERWTNMSEFAVASVNGRMGGERTESMPISGSCLILVELWAKDRNGGLKDLHSISNMRSNLVSLLPYKGEYFTLTYNNEVGGRDKLGFHSSMINLNCLIY